MPKITLNDRAIAGLKPPKDGQVEFFDRSFPGFAVRVGATGRKTFVLFHRVNGKLQRLTVRDPQTDASTYPTLTLAKARELARTALQTSSVGRDPHAERQEARERTFGKLAELYVEQHAKRQKRSWRDDARMIRQELDVWDERPVAAIRRADVRDLLEGIVQRGAPVLANRVLALVRKMLNFALDREWVEANVAAKMARPAAEQSRTRVLTADEIKQVWAWLKQPAPKDADENHWALAQAALKLRLITAQRGGEVIDMRWADVDLAARWWTIPAERSKNKLPHRVPLTDTAVKILEPLRLAADDSAHVFGGIRGTRHRRGLLDGLGIADVRPHDFRRTAASMMAGGGVPRLTIAKILNHVETSITAVYDRHSYDAEKRAALTWWDARLTAIISGKGGAKVVPFAKGA
jgi:integrase